MERRTGTVVRCDRPKLFQEIRIRRARNALYVDSSPKVFLRGPFHVLVQSLRREALRLICVVKRAYGGCIAYSRALVPSVLSAYHTS